MTNPEISNFELTSNIIKMVADETGARDEADKQLASGDQAGALISAIGIAGLGRDEIRSHLHELYRGAGRWWASQSFAWNVRGNIIESMYTLMDVADVSLNEAAELAIRPIHDTYPESTRGIGQVAGHTLVQVGLLDPQSAGARAVLYGETGELGFGEQ